MRRLFRLWRRAPAPPTTQLSTRSQIRPPDTWGQAAPVWQELHQWLTGRRPPDPLVATRSDFIAGLSGLQGRAVSDLRLRAEHARSQRELWHLRAELFNLIALQLSQGEAERRLACVNRHFSSRASSPRTRAPALPPSRHPSETMF